MANAVTNNDDTDLFAAVNALVAGFGQGGGLAYDIGEFVLSEDITFMRTSDNGIPHKLGKIPDFILIWTDDFADVTADNPAPYTTSTNLGYVWIHGLTGLMQRLTSVANNELGIFVSLTLAASDYRASAFVPTSSAYVLDVTSAPNDAVFGLSKNGNNQYWRAGVTYKYFVSEAWWNIGGAQNVE